MIEYNELSPGYYVGHWKDKEYSNLIIIVSGVSPGYVFDVMEHLAIGEGRFIADIKLHKKPIIFDKRIIEMDKES